MLKKIIKTFISKQWENKLFELKNIYLNKYAIKSYSQEGEDMILARLFEKKDTGFYVDVGAHHPQRFSNTYYFYKKGWRGINIDAMPGSMVLFNKIRSRDINIEKPVSDKKEILTFYAFNEPALNGFSKEISETRNDGVNYFIKFTKDIETLTLEEILDKNLPKDQTIDFLSIDVEGFDLKVLKSNNFNKYKPKVILIEALENHLKDMDSNEIVRYLMQAKYILMAKTIYTYIFIEENYFEETFGQDVVPPKL